MWSEERVNLDPNFVRVLLVAAKLRLTIDSALTLAQAIDLVCTDARIDLHKRQRAKLLELSP